MFPLVLTSIRLGHVDFVAHQAFDALIHFSFEGSFLYLSTFGRSVNISQGPFASFWKEYARVDFRWDFSDPTVVSLEILTVLGAGPLCCFILYQLLCQDAARHYRIVVLCTAELYGGWMMFCPEWLTGSPNLDTSNPVTEQFDETCPASQTRGVASPTIDPVVLQSYTWLVATRIHERTP